MSHTDQTTLEHILEEAKKQVEIGAKYSHYKSPEHSYLVLEIALQESSEEPVVVYQSSDPSKLVWVRPVSKLARYHDA